MACELARHWLSDESDAPRADEHLRECDDCRTYAEVLDALRYHAPAAVPPAPEELPVTVLSRLGVATRSSATASRDLPRARARQLAGPRPRRLPAAWRDGLLSAAVTAAVLALVGVVTVGGNAAPGEGQPEAVLAAAVGRLAGAEASGFHFEVEGRHELRLPPIGLDAAIGSDAGDGGDPRVAIPDPPLAPTGAAPAGTPDLPQPEPPGLTLPQLAVPGGAGYPETLDDLTGRLGLVGRDAETARDRLHLELELQRLSMRLSTRIQVSGPIGVDGVDLRYHGAGRSDGRRASAYTLDWEAVSPIPASGTMQVATVDGHRWVRSDPEIGWLDVGADAAFHLGALRASHDVSELVAAVTAPRSGISELGVREVDGHRRRGIATLHDGYRVEVWIGVDDGLPYRIDWRSETGVEGGPRLSSTATVTFSGHGAAVRVDPPRPATPLGEVPLTRFPPFAVLVDPSAG